MAFNFYDTHTLLMAVQQIRPMSTFLRDRYFPTNDATDVFATTDVLAEFRDGSKKLAPFVAPRKGGVTVLRKGYTMERYTPPTIAPRRLLTIDDLKKRGFGEALYSQMTPEQRQQILILRDAQELGDMISNREEAMAAETMLTNGCIMKHIADDANKGDEMEIRFFEGESNPAAYTGANWSDPDADIISDMDAMARMLTSRGLPATELVVSPDVGDYILNNNGIQKLLDLKNFNIGTVDPVVLPVGASRLASLNIKGRMIDVISYEESYEDDNGEDVQYFPEGSAVMTAPGAGRTLYGAVSQVEQADGEVHTYTGKRVPKYISDANGNTRTITVTSSPLMIPNNKNPFIVGKVTG